MGGVWQQEKIRFLLRSCKRTIRLCIAGGERRCNTCNIGFYDERARSKHYESSGWHYFNQERKQAGHPPVKEADFLATPYPILSVCRPCGKGFRTSEAHLQHLESTDDAKRMTGGEKQQQQQQHKIGSWKKKINLCIAGGEIRCKTCNISFNTRTARWNHYESSGWHDYNCKRKKAGHPPVKYAEFLATPSPVLYVCRPCGKGFRTLKAHAQHLKSRDHVKRVMDPALMIILGTV